MLGCQVGRGRTAWIANVEMAESVIFTDVSVDRSSHDGTTSTTSLKPDAIEDVHDLGEEANVCSLKLVRAVGPATPVARTVSRRTLVRGSAAAFALLALPGAVSRAAGRGAVVRFVNVAPGSPALDIYLNGDPAVEGLAFGEATKPARQAGGALELVVVAAGDDPSEAVFSRSLELSDDLRYVVAVLGEYPDIDAQALGVLVQPLEPDTARLRLVHLAPDLGSVDFRITDGPTFYEDVWYPGATPYTEVDAGAADFEIRPTGSSEVLLSREATTLKEGRVYDLLVFGRVADDSLRTLLLSAAAEKADEAEAGGPPTAAETAYLTSLKKSVDFLHLSLTSLDQLLQTIETDPNGSLNRLGFVFMGWVIAHRDVQAGQAPARYEGLKAAYLAVLEPLATTAREMSNVDDYMSGAADVVSFDGLDIGVMLQTVVDILPLLQEADAQFDAARAEAGLPLE